MSGGGSVEPETEQPLPSRGSATILVVDDEVLPRTVVSEELRERGYAVVEAATADEAVTVLRSPTRVDVVLTDMRMPGALDGAGLVELIRVELPFLKIVMVSGQQPDPGVLSLLDGYITKPVGASELTSYLETAAFGTSLETA